jgi:hypothetical protein
MSLHDFPKRFTSCHYLVDAVLTYDDEDLEAWEFEAKRWARVLFLAIKEEHHLISLFTVCLYGLMLYTNSDCLIFISCCPVSDNCHLENELTFWIR